MLKKILFVLSVLVVIGVGLVSPALAQGPVMYGANGKGGTDPTTVLTIDQTTGVGTVIATPLPGNGISALAFNSKNRLFAVASTGLSNAHLIELDKNSGALIADIGILRTASNVTGVIGDISFQPGTDVLFGVTVNALGGFGLGSGGYLVTIDTNTAIVTVVSAGSMSGANDNGGLAFASNGTLYFTPMDTNNNQLITVNPSTGLMVSTVPITEDMMGLGVNYNSGELWGSSYNNYGHIYKINPSTGVLTLFSTLNSGRRIHDLAFKYPLSVGGVAMPINQTTSPFNFTMIASAAALVLGLGLVVLGRVRRAQA